MAASVVEAKAEINRLAHEAEVHLAQRLALNPEDQMPIYRLESEVIEYLKRVYYFAKRIAKEVRVSNGVESVVLCKSGVA